jgi:O-acetyl-ADP-ribose deacetylase (regulator of RNase III)
MAVIKIVKGNLLDATEDIIAHQVNCMGVMGAGVAKQIKEKWPKVFEQYRKQYESWKNNPDWQLGWCDIIVADRPEGGKVLVANLYGQYGYGTDVTRTDYKALGRSLYRLRNDAEKLRAKTIAMPYKIGCGLAGGDWPTVFRMIEHYLSDFEVTLYERE